MYKQRQREKECSYHMYVTARPVHMEKRVCAMKRRKREKDRWYKAAV